jgi:uncharacterized protein (UPF0254 family)
MNLSKRSVETLVDLVEIKLSTIQIFDREDAREVAILERALNELTAINAGEGGAAGPGRRGRRPKVMALEEAV